MRAKSLIFILAWGAVALGYAVLIPDFNARNQIAEPALPPAVIDQPATPPPGQPLEKLGEFQVEIGPRRDSSGTAFAVGNNGIWITARHVIDGCSVIGLGTGPDPDDGRREYVRAKGFTVHPAADVGIITSRHSGPPLPMVRHPLHDGQTGYHFGYPQGRPASIRSRLIGEGRMRSVGRYRTREKVQIWASEERSPYFSGSPGGISGGPVFNARGQLIGMTVAGSERRGRLVTATIPTLKDMLRRSSRPTTAESGRRSVTYKISEENFATVARQYRSLRSVTKVVCAAQSR